jgi:hypothetical protein
MLVQTDHRSKGSLKMRMKSEDALPVVVVVQTEWVPPLASETNPGMEAGFRTNSLCVDVIYDIYDAQGYIGRIQKRCS